jgi:CRP-like cAMP-binding protein
MRKARAPQISAEAFLARLPMFSELNPEEIARIAAGAHTTHVPKGETIAQRGDPCTGFHVVVYGQVKLGFTSPQGVEKVVEIVGPGQSFGEALMFLERPYIVFASALEDSMLLHIAKRVVFEELEREPLFARKVISGLARRLHGLVKDVEAYTLRSGADRVIGYLLRDAPDGAVSGELKITLNAGKSVIASRLNMTPEHFSRILHELQADGLVEVSGRSIRIRDLARLRG